MHGDIHYVCSLRLWAKTHLKNPVVAQQHTYCHQQVELKDEIMFSAILTN